MKRNLASLLAGLVFGFGLALSGMTHPEKVLGFLDVAGAWDASLLFVLGGAVGVTVVTFRFILKMKKPVLAESFVIIKETHIDHPLILGAILFGTGWGYQRLLSGTRHCADRFAELGVVGVFASGDIGRSRRKIF